MNIAVCIKHLRGQTYEYTLGKQYLILHDSHMSVQLEDDHGSAVGLSKDLVFNEHFKYLSEVRDNKLKTLGI